VRVDTLVEGAAIADFLFECPRRGDAVRLDVYKQALLTATFGFKDRYSDQEIEAVCKELDEAPPCRLRAV
jgi:hypothetical protein